MIFGGGDREGVGLATLPGFLLLLAFGEVVPQEATAHEDGRDREQVREPDRHRYRFPEEESPERIRDVTSLRSADTRLQVTCATTP